MVLNYLKHLGIGYIVGLFGGLLFRLAHLPLPWILGPLISIFIIHTWTPVKMQLSLPLRKFSFMLIGLQIGTTFTSKTVNLVLPYIIPYTFFTLLLLFISLATAYILSKWISVDPVTSMLGSVPGGLTVMIALSETVNGNTGLITIFHTLRLLAVLTIVPFAATHFFDPVAKMTSENPSLVDQNQGPIWSLLIIGLVFLIARSLELKVPAALVTIPMLLIGFLQVIDFNLFILPQSFFVFAQVTLGIYLGYSIALKDIMQAGKYAVIYFLLSVFIIFIASLFGYLFSIFTAIDLATGILSFAPGGLVEMALTAQSVSGDPSIVSSLQMIRLLTIVFLVPVILKIILPKLNQTSNQ